MLMTVDRPAWKGNDPILQHHLLGPAPWACRDRGIAIVWMRIAGLPGWVSWVAKGVVLF